MSEPVKSKFDRESEIARHEIRQGNRQVRAAFDEFEKKMENGIDSGANRIQKVILRSDQVTEQFAQKIDESVDSANLLLDSALKQLGESFVRTDQVIDHAKATLDDLVDRMERVVDGMENPLETLQKDPGAALPMLVLAGMLAGMFVRRAVERRGAAKTPRDVSAPRRAA